VPDFGPIISLAYMRILRRPPDPEGLETYNQAMNSGLSEAQMRESLLRSNEYAINNPDSAAAIASSGRSKKKIKKKTKKKTRKR